MSEGGLRKDPVGVLILILALAAGRAAVRRETIRPVTDEPSWERDHHGLDVITEAGHLARA